jgi:hypothetical protein
MYAVCLSNKGYEASLEVGKLYRVLPDETAKKRGFIRAVDEEDDDYLYPASFFGAVSMPPAVARALGDGRGRRRHVG